ncbi:MAG: 16S rRNA (adenine(1518)-N(6)/adenine(1519)-N(6))-dimethyltransferase RsmA [Owenweeksia sp.]
MIRPKKHLGQHFLKDESVAEKIAGILSGEGYEKVVEIGPGMGVLTQFLLRDDKELFVVEIDRESVEYLDENFPALHKHIIPGDFLRLSLEDVFGTSFSVIGNFPYNISSQIVFKVLENRHLVPEFGGMFQKEVAERITADPGSKTYGILSVLTAAYYEREYLFTVEPEVFNPPPKVRSGVIRLKRKENYQLGCDESLFKRVVKATFNQRRKTLRNGLKSLNLSLENVDEELLKLRPEQLDLQGFIHITKSISTHEL